MWTVAVVNELNVRSGPGTEHPVIAQMNAGDVAKVIEFVDGEWVFVAANGAIGFVNAGPRSDRYLLATKTPWEAWLRNLAGVASDGETYIAYGSQLGLDYPPYELHGIPALMLVSHDGITWTEVDSGPGFAIQSVAGSEEGWVAIGSIPLGGSLMSFSPDGITWDEPAVIGDGDQHEVARGPAGWLAIGASAWTSTDGRSWDGPWEMDLESGGTNLSLESSDAGYISFDRNHPGTLAASVDGVTWTSVDHGADRVSDAELVGDRLLVVLVDTDGATEVRRGRIGPDGAVTWEGSLPTGIGGADLHVDRIAQGPNGLIAVGWDEIDLVPVTWRSIDGTSWERLPGGENSLRQVGPFEPVWGPAGWVGPALERSTDGAAWLEPDYELGYDGPVPPCPPADKVSTITLAYLGQYAEGCFGDSPLTIRAFHLLLDGIGGCCPPQGEPSWLAHSFSPGTILAVGATDEEFASWQLSVRIPPGIEVPAPPGWVEIAGHYRDPASASCVSRPQKGYPNPLASHASMQRLCRERFVVESIVEVAGP